MQYLNLKKQNKTTTEIYKLECFTSKNAKLLSSLSGENCSKKLVDQ